MGLDNSLRQPRIHLPRSPRGIDPILERWMYDSRRAIESYAWSQRPPYFHYEIATTLAIPDGALTPVQWEQKLFTTGFEESAGVTAPTIPVAGIYNIASMLRFQVETTGVRGLFVFRNDGRLIVADTQAPNTITRTCLSVSTPFYLEEGETVQVQAYQENTGASDLDIDSPSFLSLKWDSDYFEDF